jgi:hypothetical protein
VCRGVAQQLHVRRAMELCSFNRPVKRRSEGARIYSCWYALWAMAYGYKTAGASAGGVELQISHGLDRLFACMHMGDRNVAATSAPARATDRDVAELSPSGFDRSRRGPGSSEGRKGRGSMRPPLINYYPPARGPGNNY